MFPIGALQGKSEIKEGDEIIQYNALRSWMMCMSAMESWAERTCFLYSCPCLLAQLNIPLNTLSNERATFSQGIGQIPQFRSGQDASPTGHLKGMQT